DPSLAIDSTGKVYVIWSDMRLVVPPYIETPYDVFIANSTDNGQSFGKNVPVNEVHIQIPQKRPSISIDGNDVVHVAWEDMRNGNSGVYYSRSSDGANFSEDVIVNDPYNHPRTPSISHEHPSIAVHQSGSPIYVVWMDNRVGTHSIYLAKSTDGGYSFHTATEGVGGNYFFDGNFTLNGGRNSNEAVVLDDDNGILDPGILNGIDSPDRIVVPGQANLIEDLTGYRLRFCDFNDNQEWDGDEDIVVDAGLNAGVILYPKVLPERQNPEDTTIGNIITFLRWDLRNGDSMYYTIEKDERMVVGWFDVANAEDETRNPYLKGLRPGDPISGVKIEFAYKTDAGYDGSNSLTWSEALVVENPFFQIVDTGGIEVYETVDLYAFGVDSVEKLQQLNVSMVNDASSSTNVSINSMSLSIERGLPDGYDIYDYLVYNGSVASPLGMPLTNFSDSDDLMFIDGSGNGIYDRGEPLVVTMDDVEPGGQINDTFEILARGDGPHWDAVTEPFPLNDDLDNSYQETPDVAVDSAGETYVVWMDKRHMPFSEAIYFTTTALDVIQPWVLQCIPSAGSAEVPLDSAITVIFSEPMQSDTTSYVFFSPETEGLWEWNWDKTNLTFIPSSLLQDNATYSILVLTGKDRSGNLLQMPRSCSFRTVEGPAIAHFPPLDSYAGEPIDIIATISDNDTVVDATVFYMNIGETFYSQILLTLDSGSPVSGIWKGQIPAQPFMGFMSYYIVGTDGVGNTGRSPATGEYTLIVGDGEPPLINHDVVKSAQAGSEVTFTAIATDNIHVFNVRLYIKPMGSDRYNPPISMDRVGLSDEFQVMVRMPDADGNLYYYLEVVDEWGNKVSSGNETSPHKLSITGAPLDVGAIATWGTLFVVISLIYVGLFIHIRGPDEDEVEEEEEEITDEES
ncbi:MAG: Ig-like domain-containing protein, partial [Thermoplasmata archaeon]|nr:Ig-like domain-containing protein [Thermoplasmata archaeon]